MQKDKEIQMPSNQEIKISTAKCARSFEAFLEIVFKLIGLCLVYYAFKTIGSKVTEGVFNPDTLLSMVVLPAIYVLKDAHIIYEPFTIKIALSDMDVSVGRGFFTNRRDQLKLETVVNVELVTTMLGRLFGYRTLNIYAYGCWVELPFINDAIQVQAEIEDRIRKIKADS